MEQHDHRILGRRLDLFHLEESAPGMIYWHASGLRLYQLLEAFIRSRMRQHGYEEVSTPQLLPRSLWERSGHWEKFGEHMFVVPRESGRDLALKPMSCPCHLQIFNSRLRSWRDLPMRLAEFGACHRDEPSGAMHGLLRTRGFVQDDAHVICRPEQVEAEVSRFVSILSSVYVDLGFDVFEVALSLRPAKRAGSDEDWDKAEADLLSAARHAGLDPVLQPGEGAFYGPKLEFSLRDQQERSWQCGTIQLDFVLPGRLDASYISEDGERATPLMLHHAIFGSMGRFIGIFLEQNQGKLPFWIAPVQVAVLPVAEAQHAAARAFSLILEDAGLRSNVFDQAETLSRRIVDTHERMIPIQAIIGGREAAADTVTLRDGNAQQLLGHDEAVTLLSKRASMPNGG